MNSSTMPEPSGPGRYRASMAMTSSKQEGFSMRRYWRMPELSTWKMPSVSPREYSS
ncbi:hypothetical protein DSECCO2_626990 [anaerobic digester metagenome]